MLKKIGNIVINITPNCVTIYDSYKIKSRKEIKKIISNIIKCHPLCTRSAKSMVDEWCVHNLLYNMNIQRQRTGSVDLNNNQKWIFKIGYWVLAKFYWK